MDSVQGGRGTRRFPAAACDAREAEAQLEAAPAHSSGSRYNAPVRDSAVRRPPRNSLARGVWAPPVLTPVLTRATCTTRRSS